MAFRKIKAGLVNGDVEQFIGETGNLFFDIDTGALRLSDGSTPGGVAVSTGSGDGNYTLPTASSTTKGGVKIGSNITITDGVISVAAPFSGSYNDLTNKPTIPSLTGYATETFVTTRGYLTSVGTISYNDLSNKPSLFDGAYASLSGKPALFSGNYTDLTNKPTIPTNTNQLTNGAEFITSYTETDPIFVAHAAYNVTTTKISNWDTAYGWGDHSVVGYLTPALWTNPSPSPGSPFQTRISGSSGSATFTLRSGLPNLGSSVTWIFDETKLTFPDTTIQTTAYTGNATTVTNGVYTTGTYANPSWITSLAYSKLTGTPTLATVATSGSYTDLTNKPTIPTTVTVNGTSITLGSSGTVTAAAGTLTGTTLNSSVVSSSLTSVGTLTGVTSNAATAFIAGDAAISGVALQMPSEGALRNLTNGLTNMYFDVSTGGTTQGQFQFRSSNAFTNVLTMSPTAFNVSTDAVVTSRTPSFGRLPFNSAIDTELTIDGMRFRVSNQGGNFPQVIGNGASRNLAWTVVAARSGSAVTQTGSTGTIVASNAWTSLYTAGGMDSAGDTYVATIQDKGLSRIYRVTFMRSDNGSTTGYNIIAERLL
jgi:hypothetical protein